MPLLDSVDKIVSVYLAAVCKEEFTYRNIRYGPRPLSVSPLLFRGFTCPPRCGGCCPRFSLDYLPAEEHPYPLTRRSVSVNGREVEFWSDLQRDHSDYHCRNLDPATGRCGIYERRPFSCDFELIRFIHRQQDAILTQKLFGRGWAMLRVDGERRALCEMTPATAWTTSEVVRKLGRLRLWADHLGVVTWLDEIIAWVETGPHDSPLRLPPPE